MMSVIDDPLVRLVRAGGSVVLATQELALDSLALACYCSGMTNTAAPSLPSELGEEVPMDQLEREAAEAGSVDGKAAASWLEISSESDARRLLQLIEDGDPVLDEYRPASPLSQEWADGKSVRDVIEFDLDLDPESVTAAEEAELISSYEGGFWLAWEAEVERRARVWVAEFRAELESEALAAEAELA